jgi:predicted transposase YbfD/YdcC
VATEQKSNEITAVPTLPEMIALKGRIVTADALNCQRIIAAKVIGKGGVLALKANQNTCSATCGSISMILCTPKR